MSQDYDPASFEVDHVVPEKMDGETIESNLCLACFKCNNHKGPNIAGIDPESAEKTFLFDPRNDDWVEHFRWSGPLLRGKTPQGRTTIELLQINMGHRVAHRRQLIAEGVFPPIL
jgi:hypothetical protein